MRRAAEVAESVGALASAGQATLTLIEEHGTTRRLPPAEVYEANLRADSLLKDTQDAEDVGRLRACARVALRRLADTPIHEKNFSLYGAVHEFEARLIGQALDEAGGSVTKAARFLGFTHQTLISILETRYKALTGKMKPIQKRLKSIIKSLKINLLDSIPVSLFRRAKLLRRELAHYRHTKKKGHPIWMP